MRRVDDWTAARTHWLCTGFWIGLAFGLFLAWVA
jgi:hypothetical protein